MSELLEIVPLALTIAFSPIPLAGTLMMFASPSGLRASIVFVIGWIVGIAFALTTLALLASLIPFPTAIGERDTASIVPLAIGVLLFLVGLGLWRRAGRAAGEDPVAPRWLTSFQNLTPTRAAAFGFVYAAFRPKNLAMTLAAGVIIQQSGEDRGTGAAQVAAFTLIASASLILPLLLFLLGGGNVRRALIAFRLLIVKHMSRITSGTFLAVGLVLGIVSALRLIGVLHGS